MIDAVSIEKINTGFSSRPQAKIAMSDIFNAAAVREGGTNRFNTGVYPAASKQPTTGKTREEVINELLRETPAERDARQRSMGG